MNSSVFKYAKQKRVFKISSLNSLSSIANAKSRKTSAIYFNVKATRFYGSCLSFFAVCFALAMCGCGSGIHSSSFSTTTGSSSPISSSSSAQGHVFGGKSSISGATIQLYAASTTGYGALSQPLLNKTVTTDTSGLFSIANAYTCPSTGTKVYMVAVGGDAGGGNNSNSILFAALGDCGAINASTPIFINEVTTVASVFALSPFMADYRHVGTDPANLSGIARAFGTVSRLADMTSGQAPGTLPKGSIAPTSKINTLADILAGCVESSGGKAGDHTVCGQLFSLTTSIGAAAPTDTVAATLSMAKNPSANVSLLSALLSTNPPFQPTMLPTDFTLALTYKPLLSNPSAAAIDQTGNIWIANTGNSTLSVIDLGGNLVFGSALSAGGLNQPSGVAIDPKGNAWIANKGSSSLSVFTPNGIGALVSSALVNQPSAITADASGKIWTANSGDNSISQITVSGVDVVSSSKYSSDGINTPTSLVVTPF